MNAGPSGFREFCPCLPRGDLRSAECSDSTTESDTAAPEADAGCCCWHSGRRRPPLTRSLGPRSVCSPCTDLQAARR